MGIRSYVLQWVDQRTADVLACGEMLLVFDQAEVQ